MRVDVRAELTINSRPRDVAAFAMDPSNDTKWIGGIRKARILTEPPFAVGTRVERVAGFLGKRIEYVLEVEELRPGALIAMRSVKAPFPMHVTYEFDGVAGNTLALIRIQGDPGGFYRLAGPRMAGAIRRNISGDLQRLKRLTESETGHRPPN